MDLGGWYTSMEGVGPCEELEVSIAYFFVVRFSLLYCYRIIPYMEINYLSA